MAIQHPVFCRKVEKNKVLVMTVVDIDSLPIDKKDVDVFFIATTESNSLFTGKNPTMTFDVDSKVSAKRYVEIINDKGGGYGVHDTANMSIDGIATEAYWFIKKFKTIMEQMYG
jgi:hypothetical protein